MHKINVCISLCIVSLVGISLVGLQIIHVAGFKIFKVIYF